MAAIKAGFKSFDEAAGGLEMQKIYSLIGNKESGKEEFLYKLVSSALSSKTPVVYVTTSRSYSDLINEFNSRHLPVSQYLGADFMIFDDFSKISSPNVQDTNYAKILNGPLDLTGLSVALSAADGNYLKEGRSVFNVIDSVSNLLVYSNPSTIFRFLQFICGRSKMSGATTLFSLDSEMHPPEVTETIKSMSDGVISLKLDNGARYFTFTGSTKEILKWTELN
jgi:KaiC/GvpD/RAD55 family RecA-like ATPase